MPPFWVEGTSLANSPSNAPLSSVYSRPRNANLVPLMTLPPSLVISVFMMDTCCHSPMVSVLPPGLAAAAAGVVGLVAGGAVGGWVGLAAAGAVGLAGAVVATGALVAAGALVDGGAVGVGAHAPSTPSPTVPTSVCSNSRRCRRLTL